MSQRVALACGGGGTDKILWEKHEIDTRRGTPSDSLTHF